jgi:hypothetical protein
VSPEKLLALTQLTTTAVVDSKLRHDAVDDEEAVVTGSELLDQAEDNVMLMLTVEGSYGDDVVVGEVGID